MAEKMREVSGEELKKLVSEGKTVVCDFWAAWCMPCRMLAPVLDKVAVEFKGSAEFVKLNIDEHPETAAEYGVMSIPDVFVFANGSKKAHSLGFAPEEELREFLQENL
ncbi:MAG: thioredoxin [Clostridiales bacterium]|nr:thioredoxin [Clostridiales bacterium]